MKFFYKTFIFTASLCMFLFLSSLVAGEVKAETYVIGSFTNNGNSTGTLYYRAWSGTHCISSGGCITADHTQWASKPFPAYGSVNISIQDIWPDNPSQPYAIEWDPIKPWGPAPGDSGCTDPTTYSDFAMNLGGIYYYSVSDSFTCNVPAAAPGSFSVSGYYECSGGNSGLRITGGGASGATGYKIYWRVTGSSSDSPRSETYYQTLVGGLPYTNYTFTPGTSFTWDVAAVNSGGETWSSNGWFAGTAPSCTASPGAFNAYNPSVACNGTSAASITFSWGVSSGATSYDIFWRTDGGNPRLLGSPNATYGATSYYNGTFSLGVRVYWDIRAKDASGATAWTTNGYYYTDTPSVATCTGGSSTPSCVGTPSAAVPNTTISFTASGGNGTYSWSGGGSPASGSGITFNTSWPTTGTKTVTVTSGGKSGTCSVTISINPTPSPGGVPTPTPPPPPPSGSWGITAVGGCQTSTQFKVNANFSVPSGYMGYIDIWLLLPSGGGSFWYRANSSLAYSGPFTPYTGNGSVLFYDGYNNFLAQYPSQYQVQLHQAYDGLTGMNTGKAITNGTIPTCSAPPPAPTADIKANGADGSIVITYNTAATISWSSTNATSCSVTKAGAAFGSGTSNGGTSSGNLTSNTVFVISCTGTGGNASDSVTVNLGPTNPSNLSASIICGSGNLPQITFSFTGAVNQTGYWLDVTTTTAGWGTWGVKTLGSTATGFVWSSTNALDSGTPTLPANSTNYYWRVKAFNANGQGSHIYPPSTTVSPGTMITGLNCNAPTNLTIDPLPSCSASAYNVTFRWIEQGSPWTLQVSNNNWASVLSSKDVSNVTTTTGPAGFSPAITFNPTTQYWWRIQYGASYATPTATYSPFSVPGCLDLKARFVRPFAQQEFAPNDTANLTVRVSNVGSLNYGGGAIVVGQGPLGLWPTGGPQIPATASSCTATVVPNGQSYAVGALAVGASQDIAVSFNVGTTSGVANAFILPTCSPADIYWPNNHTSGTSNPANPADVDGLNTPAGGFVYTINVDAWFQTVGGDVGTSGYISNSQTPPNGLYQSDFLLVGSGINTEKVKQNPTTGFMLRNYAPPLKLMPASTYNYLAERFLAKAKLVTQSNFTSLANGLSYYNGSVTLGASAFPAGRNSVWFIDGSLTITGNITVDPTSTVTLIVRDNILVNTSVTRTDGLYIAGGNYTDITDSTNISGAQLLVNGGVYTQTISLGRELGGTACPSGVLCDNRQTAAEKFVYDPKYLVQMNLLLATPDVSWSEVTP